MATRTSVKTVSAEGNRATWIAKGRQPSPFAVSNPAARSTGKAAAILRGEKSIPDGWGGASATSFSRYLAELGGTEDITNPYRENHWVHAALKVLGQAVSSVPLKWYEGSDSTEREVTGHPLAKLFKRPHPFMAPARFFQAALLNRKLDGEDFWFCYGGDGEPWAPGAEVPKFITPIRGERVEMDLDDSGIPIAYKYRTAAGRAVVFPVDSVVALLDYDPSDPRRGIGDVECVARLIYLQWQAERYQEAALRNGGDYGGWIEMTKDMQPEAVERLQRQVDDELSNADNKGRYKVLPPSMKYTATSVAPKDMEWNTLLTVCRTGILGGLGVPPPLVGIWENATYNNLAEAKVVLWTGGNGVLSFLATVESEINETLVPRVKGAEGIRARFDISQVEALRQFNSQKIRDTMDLVGRGIGMSWNEATTITGLEGPEPAGGATRFSAPGLIAQSDGEEETPTILNGAQLAQAFSIVASVAAGEIPRDSGVGMLETLFGLSSVQAEQIMASAGRGTPTDPNPNPIAEVAASAPAPAPPSKSFLSAQSRNDVGAERRVWFVDFEKRLLKPNDDAIQRATEKFLRKYEAAQMKRIADVALKGKSARGMAGTEIVKWLGAPVKEALERRTKELEIPADLLDALNLNAKEWEAKFAALVDGPIARAYSLSASDAAQTIGGEVFLDVNDPRVAQLLSRQQIQLVEGVNSTLAKQVREALARALASDSVTASNLQEALAEIIPELDEHLEGVFGSKEARALAIARTESARAANAVRFEHMTANEITSHEWVDSGDDHVRESHAIDGEQVAIGGTFSNGLKYPHDESAPAGEVVNCRCTTRPVVE